MKKLKEMTSDELFECAKEKIVRGRSEGNGIPSFISTDKGDVVPYAFVLRDLFVGYEWDSVPLGVRKEAGRLFYFAVKHDEELKRLVSDVGKSSLGQQLYLAASSFDECLKELEKCAGNAEECFGYRVGAKIFRNYFRNGFYDGVLPESVKSAYERAAGGELLEANGFPPKFYSVASSSRFCCLSLKDSELSVFGVSGKSGDIEFEKELPTGLKGVPPTLDAYYDGGEEDLFFECKCHEMFFDKKLTLAKSYLKLRDFKEAFGGSVTADGDIDLCGATLDFGVDVRKTKFDVKQLLTHLAGIKGRSGDKRARLAYFYFFPKEMRTNDYSGLYSGLCSDVRAIFASPIVRRVIGDDRIKLEMYVFSGPVVRTADESNVEMVVSVDA